MKKYSFTYVGYNSQCVSGVILMLQTWVQRLLLLHPVS